MTLKVNGRTHRITADPATPSVYVLRNELGLKGAKLGCGLEQCGACAVLVDGKPEPSCVSTVESFYGKEITTVEGLQATQIGRRVQVAFVEASAAQCGYCTAGMVVAVTGLLDANPAPSRPQTAEALTPHLCRCGARASVFRAIEVAAGCR